MKIKLLCLPLLLLMLASVTSKAQTSLPYIGPEQANCHVVMPDDPRNAGYYTSEDCQNIYVKPPSLGEFYVSDTVYSSKTLLCKPILSLYERLANYFDLKGLSDEKVLARSAKIKEFGLAIKSISGTEPVSYTSIAVFLDWDSLLAKYQKLNPDSNVQRLPITFGLFSTSIGSSGEKDFLSTEEGLSYSLKVHGLRVDEDTLPKDLPFGSLLDKSKMDSGSVSLLMGDSLSLGLSLNLAGTCALKNSFATKGAGDSSAFLSGTYTYFYPIQTKSLFKVSFNREIVENEINELVKKNNGIVSESDIDEISAKGGIQIEIHEGAFPGGTRGKELEADYKDEIMESAKTALLTNIGTRSQDILKDATYEEPETRSGRSCHRRFGFKRCHNYSYVVSVTKINWETVEDEIKKSIGETSSRVSHYQSVYISGSSAIVPNVLNLYMKEDLNK